MKNKKLLKSGYSISATSSFLSLFSALFITIPVYYASLIILSLAEKASKENSTPAILMAALLIIFTLAKIILSIFVMVFSFKTRKLTHQETIKTKTPLTLAVLCIILATITIVSVSLKFSIKYVNIIEIISSALLITSFILLLIYYIKSRKINQDKMTDQPNPETVTNELSQEQTTTD